MNEFSLITGCKGYLSRTDPTNSDEGYLIQGSQNVLINDTESNDDGAVGGKVVTRGGYELFAQANDASNPIQSEFVWKNHNGDERFLREENGVLKYYDDDSKQFEQLLTGLSTTKPIRFATYWNITEGIDILVFVANSTTLYEWSGARGTIAGDASVTAGTITIQEAIATEGFFTAGTRSIRIKYSGGTWRETVYTAQSGSDFTVSTDLSAFTFDDDAPVVQVVRQNANTPASGFTNDTIKTLQNQMFVGSESSRRIYVSRNTDNSGAIPLFTFSSPRLIGEGALNTMDDVTIGMEVDDNNNQMIVFSGKNRVYRAFFEVSPGSTADRENVLVKPLLVGEGQGAISQELIGKAKQAIYWVTNNKELVELAQVQNLPSPQSKPISDPISTDFFAATFTNGNVKTWRNYLCVTCPTDGNMWIFDLVQRFWNPPQKIGVRLLSIYSDLLYGHSNSVNETYKLFTGVNDNGNPISFKAHFAYRNGGKRANLKVFDKYFTELYIASNTKVTVKLLYEWKGAKAIKTYELSGADATYLFTPQASAALGVNSLGTNPLGGQLTAGENTPKYRRIKKVTLQDFFEFQIRFECEMDDAVFQILSHGANMSLSDSVPSKITN